MKRLNRRHIKAMRAVKDGADVYSMPIAEDLREVERDHPHLIHITKAQDPPPGQYQQPYFGAILTPAGKRAIGEWKGEEE